MFQISADTSGKWISLIKLGLDAVGFARVFDPGIPRTKH